MPLIFLMGNARAARGQEANLKLSYNVDYTSNWFTFLTLDPMLKFFPKLDLTRIEFFPPFYANLYFGKMKIKHKKYQMKYKQISIFLCHHS